MRDLTFRAWDNKNKKWLLGYDVGTLGGFSMFGECMMFGEWAQILSTGLSGKNGYNLNDLVVMQFTGLRDSKDRKIYEGDILKPIDSKVSYAVVEWDEYKWVRHWSDVDGAERFKMDLESLDLFEVVGNIYENPELIKV